MAAMRDIAAAAEMQAASVYYYFESKEELLSAVWEKGGLELLHRVADAIVNKTDPWQRMETACVAPTRRFSSCGRRITPRASGQGSSHCGTNTKRSSSAWSTTFPCTRASIAAICVWQSSERSPGRCSGSRRSA